MSALSNAEIETRFALALLRGNVCEWVSLASLCRLEERIALANGDINGRRLFSWRAKYAELQANTLTSGRPETPTEKLARIAAELRAVGVLLGSDFTVQMDSIAHTVEWVGEIVDAREAANCELVHSGEANG